MSLHWQIRRLKVADGAVVVGDTVAEIRAAGGEGDLKVFDPSLRDLLEELFTEEQIALTGREVEEDGRLERTTADILQPWQPETLAWLRDRLGRYGLVAVEPD